MSNDLGQYGLCLIAERIEWSVVPMCGEFEWLDKLPFEIDCQANGYLVPGKAMEGW